MNLFLFKTKEPIIALYKCLTHDINYVLEKSHNLPNYASLSNTFNFYILNLQSKKKIFFIQIINKKKTYI